MEIHICGLSLRRIERDEFIRRPLFMPPTASHSFGYSPSIRGRNYCRLSCLAVLAGLVSAPWWLTIYLQHGIVPFISAASSGVHDLFPLTVFISRILFARDTFIPILMILRVAGIVWEMAHRRFTLLLWAALAYFLDQRSAGATSFLAFSLLCAIGFADALPFVFDWIRCIIIRICHAEVRSAEASRSSLKKETRRCGSHRPDVLRESDISKNFLQLRWLNADSNRNNVLSFRGMRSLFLRVGQYQLAYTRAIPSNAMGERKHSS